MGTVNAVLATQTQVFPTGTIGGDWRFTIAAEGGPIAAVTPGPACTFNGVAPGTWQITGTRLNNAGNPIGPLVLGSVTVADPGVSLEVALSISGTAT